MGGAINHCSHFQKDIKEKESLFYKAVFKGLHQKGSLWHEMGRMIIREVVQVRSLPAAAALVAEQEIGGRCTFKAQEEEIKCTRLGGPLKKNHTNLDPLLRISDNQSARKIRLSITTAPPSSLY